MWIKIAIDWFIPKGISWKSGWWCWFSGSKFINLITIYSQIHKIKEALYNIHENKCARISLKREWFTTLIIINEGLT